MAHWPGCSWRPWKTRWAFWTGWTFYEHARLDDSWFSLLALLTSWSANPFIQSVLVGWHPWPNTRRVSPIIIAFVVIFILSDCFLCEVSVGVFTPFIPSASHNGFVIGDHRACGNFHLNANFRQFFHCVKVIISIIGQRRVVFVNGFIIIIAPKWIIHLFCLPSIIHDGWG